MINLKPSTTLLEAVKKSLEVARHNNISDTVPPAAVLWADADGQWQPVVDQLRPLMSELFTLGDYNQQRRSGPAIWLRCVIDRTLESIRIPDDCIPIIYLPRVSRQTLRAGEECPDIIKPLVELQYRGSVWSQRNGRDWTVEVFLVSDDGLGLDVAEDRQTHIAMLGALEQLAVTPISRLLSRKLEVEDFDRLMIYDTPRDVLTWLNHPGETREKWDQNKWAAFCSRCKTEYHIDPVKDGELTAAEKLGKKKNDAWNDIWQRFKEAPGLYPDIANQLRRAKLSGELLFDKEPWPDENDKEENTLRQALLSFETLNTDQAR